MNLLEIIRDVDFEFGIGDPTFFGWFTVVAYLIAAGLAVANAWRLSAVGTRNQRRLWWGLGVLLLFLAINKQLDIQSYLTAVGRAVARSQGWYEQRGIVQLLFVAIVGAVVLAAVGLVLLVLRDVLRQQRLTVIGIIMILGFVLVRASSFHYIDILIGFEIGGFRLNWVFELGAIGVFCYAAYRQLQRSSAMEAAPAEPDVEPWFDRRWRLATFLVVGVGLIAGAGALMLANSITPDTSLEPERRLYEGAVPTYDVPVATERFVESFSGSPTAPSTWPETGWDVTIHSRDFDTWRQLEEMQADFGDDCAPPPSTHAVSAYDEAVFQCDDRLVTAINASGFGAIFLTPDHLLDLSEGGTIRWQMSTERTSPTDWPVVWISPYNQHVQLPNLAWLSNLSGPPADGLYLEMSFSGNNFVGQQFIGHQGTELPTATFDSYDTVLDPSRTTLTTFEITLSSDHLRIGLPEHDLWWIDTELATPLDWDRAVVQFGHVSASPGKCDEGADCGPNSWHWDNVALEPAVPFTILAAEQDFIDFTQVPEVFFEQPAAEDSHLRFAGTGRNLEVSLDGGFSWESAQLQTQEVTDESSFQNYWHPVPAGTWYVRFRADNESDWHVRDISIWSPNVETG